LFDLLLVDWPVDFDNQRSFPTEEINDITVNGVLAAKFVTGQAPIT
jgi:hypothetical protein